MKKQRIVWVVEQAVYDSHEQIVGWEPWRFFARRYEALSVSHARSSLRTTKYVPASREVRT